MQLAGWWAAWWAACLVVWKIDWSHCLPFSFKCMISEFFRNQKCGKTISFSMVVRGCHSATGWLVALLAGYLAGGLTT